MQQELLPQLEKMFKENYNEWCLFSFSYLGDMKEAEEVVQDVCVAILLKKKKGHIKNLSPYIITSIKNKSLKKIKQFRRFKAIGNEHIKTSQSIEEDLIHKENKLHLQKAIESLPDPCRKAFQLCIIDGLKYQNTAEVLGISINTVKYHIKKAYKILRIEMENAHFLEFIFIVSSFYHA